MDAGILRRIPLFSSLPAPELEELGKAFHLIEHPAGVTLFDEGDPGGTFGVLLDGEIEIVKATGTPEEVILSVLGAGDYLGEMSLLNPEGTRTAGARTRTRLRIIELARHDFEALLERRPRLALDIVRVISGRLHGREDAAIRDLEAKNLLLSQAYEELKAAQAQLIEQEKLAHELDIAHRIQAGLLPKALPAIPKRRVEVHWQPARAVGGDFYDFIDFPGGRTGIVVGDVSGKGVPAALVMATTRSVFRPAAERLVSPGAVLEQVNELLCPDMPANMFVTCLYVLLNHSTGRIEFANAGHNLPFLCTLEAVVELRATGMPLGLMPGMQYEQRQAMLGPDHSLVLYSDGISEAHSPEREMFGVKGLQARLQELFSRPGPVRSLVPTLLEALESFTGPGWEQEDDVTLMSLEPE